MTDKFYTKTSIAKKCYDIFIKYVKIDVYDYILEPSAGNGAFFNLLPKDKRIGIDIDPQSEKIQKLDFFKFKPREDKKYAVIGNPPFGRVSSLAIKFFNYASSFANIIGFIVPRTFKRVSIQNKLNLNFRLIYNKDLPLVPCCFEPKMSAKCCFQIWERTQIKREKIVYSTKCKDFDFLDYIKNDDGKLLVPENASFAIKAYGSNCGYVNKNIENLSPKSWHFIKSNINTKILIDRFNSLDYSISKDTVRQDSIGRGELVYLYTSKYNY